MNWTTGKEPETVTVLKVPRVKKVSIRRLPNEEHGRLRRSTAFRHQGREVEVGEVIECDAGDARELVGIGKAEFV